MATVDWKPFLTRWSKELMTTDLADQVEPAPPSPDWLGYAPATADEIEELEHRLGVRMPPSYKAFLTTTNGWRRTTTFIGRLRPTTEVSWFRVENEQWVEVFSEHGSESEDEEYYDYSAGSAHDHRAAHMESLLQISDVEDGVYLLNPKAVTSNGEWEAWFFANWIPGAQRYPSFAHLMLREYESFVRIHKVESKGAPLPVLETPSPKSRRYSAKKAGAPATSPSLENLIEQMASSDVKTREKVVRTFMGKLQGRPSARRRPDLVQPLCALFHQSPDAYVRGACVAALTELAADSPAPAPLFVALSDPDPAVVLQGIFALHYFPDSRALKPLCRFIESRANVLFNETAMSHLGKMGDERAVPTLAGVLLDPKNSFPQSIGTAGQALGRCGSKGFDVLVTALEHKDPRVRLAALVGIDISGDPRAEAHLKAMARDPDPQVRQRAKQRVGDLYKFLMGGQG